MMIIAKNGQQSTTSIIMFIETKTAITKNEDSAVPLGLQPFWWWNHKVDKGALILTMIGFFSLLLRLEVLIIFQSAQPQFAKYNKNAIAANERCLKKKQKEQQDCPANIQDCE